MAHHKIISVNTSPMGRLALPVESFHVIMSFLPPSTISALQLASKEMLEIANDRNSREVFALLAKPDLSPNLSIQGWIRDNPIVYLSLLSDENKTSPVAMSLIRYHNLPEKQLWEAIRVSKETGQPPFLPRLYSNDYSQVAILDNGHLVAWGNPEFGGTTPAIPEGRTISCNYRRLSRSRRLKN